MFPLLQSKQANLLQFLSERLQWLYQTTGDQKITNYPELVLVLDYY